MQLTIEPTLRPLGLARAAFGVVFLMRTTPLLAPLDPGFLRGGNGWLGWPDRGWHVPALELPAVIVGGLVLIRTLAALAMMLGVHTRWAGLIAGLAGYLVLAQDAFGYLHHLHMLYLGAIVFAIIDSDAALALRPRAASSVRSSLLLARAFVASIYAWAAIGKLLSEWGTGVPLSAFLANGALDASLVGDLLATQTRCAVIEIIVIASELALGCCLLWPRTRRYALIAAFALHAPFELIGRVDTIGWQMAALLLVFTSSAQPRRDTR